MSWDGAGTRKDGKDGIEMARKTMQKTVVKTIAHGVTIENGEFAQVDIELSGKLTRERAQAKARKLNPDFVCKSVEHRALQYLMTFDTFFKFAEEVREVDAHSAEDADE